MFIVFFVRIRYFPLQNGAIRKAYEKLKADRRIIFKWNLVADQVRRIMGFTDDVIYTGEMCKSKWDAMR